MSALTNRDFLLHEGDTKYKCYTVWLVTMVGKTDYNAMPILTLTNLNRAIVCRSFLPFKISWFHLSGFVVKLTNASLCIAAIRMNTKRLAAVFSDAFKLTFEFINSKSRFHDMTN